MNVTSQLGYILTPFVANLYCCLWKNEENLTVCNSPCVQRISVNWTHSGNFESLACSIYRFMDLVCKTQLHQPAKATHPTRYNTSALLLSTSSLTVTTNQKEHVSLCNGELYRNYFRIGQSPQGLRQSLGTAQRNYDRTAGKVRELYKLTVSSTHFYLASQSAL